MRGHRGYRLLLAVLALLLAACGQVSEPAPPAEGEIEEQNFESSLYSYGNDVAVDSKGNVYVVGSTRCSSHRFDCTAYIRKYDANNKFLWRKTFRISTAGQERDTAATSVSVDANGNAFVVGTYFWHIPAGFVRKYSSNGSPLWTQLFYLGVFGYEGGAVLGSAVDNWGNLYVVGQDMGEIEAETNLGFIHKFDRSGSRLWTQRFHLGGHTIIYAAAVGPKGGLVVVGQYWEDPDDDPWTDNSITHGFLRKYRPNSNLYFERRFDVGDGYDDNATGVVIDDNGNIYVTGTKSNSTVQGAYLRKFNEWGTQLWSKVIWGSKRSGHDVAVDASGNVFLAGIYRYSGSDYDTFVTKYSASGSFLWTTGKDIRWNPKTAEEDIAIATRTGNAIYLIGSTEGKVGPDRYGRWDAYLVRLNGWGRFVWAD